MSERGAEGILRRQAEAKAAAAAKPAEKAKPAQPVDKGTAGDSHTPGRAKRAAAGAAGGAVAGPGGAAAGGIAGLLSGGGKKKRSGPGHRALVAEFVICMAILALSPMVDKGGDITTSKFMKKASATAAVFIILGFIASAGDTARKAANGLGLLMTMTVLLNERSIFGQLVKAVNGDGVPIPKVSLPDIAPPNGTHDAAGNPYSFQEQWELGGGIAADAGRATHEWLKDFFGRDLLPPDTGQQVPGGNPGQTGFPGMGGI